MQDVIDVAQELSVTKWMKASQDAPDANTMFATIVYQSTESKQMNKLLQGKYQVKVTKVLISKSTLNQSISFFSVKK